MQSKPVGHRRPVSVHHAVRVTIRTARDLVLVEKAQTLVRRVQHRRLTRWVGLRGGAADRESSWGNVPREPGGFSRPLSRRSAAAGASGRSRRGNGCRPLESAVEQVRRQGSSHSPVIHVLTPKLQFLVVLEHGANPNRDARGNFYSPIIVSPDA